MTQVINIRNAPEGWENDPQYVYIGRQSPWHRPKPLKRSKWCNPFVIQNPTEAERASSHNSALPFSLSRQFVA